MKLIKPESPQIKWLEGDLPYSGRFKDTYFSKVDGLNESRFVFLEAADLYQKWMNKKDETPFVIGELGFGTGLNFLLVQDLWDTFQKEKKPNFDLQFHSVEKYPLTLEEIKKALLKWKKDLPHLNALELPIETRGVHLFPKKNNLELTLYYEDVNQALDFFPVVDIWFLDGFAPSRNTEMWEKKVLEKIALQSYQNSEVVTFSAAGEFRRGLEKAFFEVKKLPGFGSKKERVTASFSLGKQKKTPKIDEVAIIGGGIAGASLAYALSQKNISSTLFEKEKIANQASGNEMGIVTPHLGMSDHPISVFTSFAFDYFRKFANNLDSSILEKKGLLQFPTDSELESRYQKIKDSNHYPESLLGWIKAEDLELISGISLSDSLSRNVAYFKDAFCVKPRVLCQWLIENSKATVKEQTEIKSIDFEGGNWQLKDARGESLHRASHIVLTNAYEALRLSQTDFLPLQRLKGQVDLLSATVQSNGLKTILSYEGYLTPSFDFDGNKVHLIGATHERGDQLDQETSFDASKKLQAELHTRFKRLNDLNKVVQSRASIRTMSPDNLPVVGQVPNRALFEEAYCELHHGKKINLTKDQKKDLYYPRFYSLLGLGSRGLTTALYSARLLSDLICDEKSHPLLEVINADRFLLRSLRRPPHLR